ncbi:MAG: hypothetical protein ACREQD_16755, partial [Candidatus Binataceae bacterium]
MFDLKVEHERIDRCVRPRLLPRAVNDGLPNLRADDPPNLRVLDGDRAQEFICVLRGQPAEKMLCVLQVITPIGVITPRQALAREEDREKPVGVLDQRTDVT